MDSQIFKVYQENWISPQKARKVASRLRNAREVRNVAGLFLRIYENINGIFYQFISSKIIIQMILKAHSYILI